MARKILEIFKDVLIVVLALAIVVLTLLALPARTITSTPWLAAILRPVAPLFGLSQSELARRANVGLRAIQMYEQRNKNINHAQGATLYRLSRVLGCGMEDLLER